MLKFGLFNQLITKNGINKITTMNVAFLITSVVFSQLIIITDNGSAAGVGATPHDFIHTPICDHVDVGSNSEGHNFQFNGNIRTWNEFDRCDPDHDDPKTARGVKGYGNWYSFDLSVPDAVYTYKLSISATDRNMKSRSFMVEFTCDGDSFYLPYINPLHIVPDLEGDWDIYEFYITPGMLSGETEFTIKIENMEDDSDNLDCGIVSDIWVYFYAFDYIDVGSVNEGHNFQLSDNGEIRTWDENDLCNPTNDDMKTARAVKNLEGTEYSWYGFDMSVPFASYSYKLIISATDRNENYRPFNVQFDCDGITTFVERVTPDEDGDWDIYQFVIHPGMLNGNTDFRIRIQNARSGSNYDCGIVSDVWICYFASDYVDVGGPTEGHDFYTSPGAEIRTWDRNDKCIPINDIPKTARAVKNPEGTNNHWYGYHMSVPDPTFSYKLFISATDRNSNYRPFNVQFDCDGVTYLLQRVTPDEDGDWDTYEFHITTSMLSGETSFTVRIQNPVEESNFDRGIVSEIWITFFAYDYVDVGWVNEHHTYSESTYADVYTWTESYPCEPDNDVPKTAKGIANPGGKNNQWYEYDMSVPDPYYNYILTIICTDNGGDTAFDVRVITATSDIMIMRIDPPENEIWHTYRYSINSENGVLSGSTDFTVRIENYRDSYGAYCGIISEIFILPDYDDDMVSDYDEISYNTLLVHSDSDDDHLSDHYELVTSKSNPIMPSYLCEYNYFPGRAPSEGVKQRVVDAWKDHGYEFQWVDGGEVTNHWGSKLETTNAWDGCEAQQAVEMYFDNRNHAWGNSDTHYFMLFVGHIVQTDDDDDEPYGVNYGSLEVSLIAWKKIDNWDGKFGPNEDDWTFSERLFTVIEHEIGHSVIYDLGDMDDGVHDSEPTWNSVMFTKPAFPQEWGTWGWVPENNCDSFEWYREEFIPRFNYYKNM